LTQLHLFKPEAETEIMTSCNNTTNQAFHTFDLDLDLDPRAALQAAIQLFNSHHSQN
jgi:hypothetical protein